MPRLSSFYPDHFIITPYLLAGLSGLALSLAFPRVNLWPLVFVGLIPLLYAARGQEPKTAFTLGLLAGWVFSAISLYWLVRVLTFYGGLPLILAYPAFLLLTGYAALYTALFMLGLSLAEKHLKLEQGTPAWILIGAALYTGLEYGKGIFLTGFPWEPLAAALLPCLTMIQFLDVLGTGGLTFAIVLINLSLFTLVIRIHARGATACLGPAFLIMLTLSVLWGYGLYRMTEVRGAVLSAPVRKMAIAQGNIDQSLKWDRAHRVKILITYQQLTLEAAKQKPWMIVWPETAIPFYFQREIPETDWLESLTRQAESALLFGSPAVEFLQEGDAYYNRVYLLDRSSRALGYYDKAHLVPYGEYVPLQRFFPFIGKLTQAAGEWTPGKAGKVLDIEQVRLGVLICYESLFPSLARLQVKNGALLLINPTNDAWYGRTSAPYQLLSLAVMRAVENRRSMVRAANTGVSAFIRPTGEILNQTDIFKTGLIVGEVPLLNRKTVYTIIGDIFSQTCLGIAFVVFITGRLRRKRYVIGPENKA